MPTKITGLYFRRLGGIGARGIARIIRRMSGEQVDIILTHGFGGGADMYLDGQIAKKVQAGTIVVLVKPDRRFSGILGVDIINSHRKESFISHSLKDLVSLHGRDCTIIINELVHWHLYDVKRVASVLALERLTNEILRLKHELAADMIYLVHDYYCLCPRYTLIALDGHYCASELTMERCQTCMSSVNASWIPFLPGVDVSRWRSCFGRIFAQCKEVRTFSNDSKSRIEACFFGVAPTLVPHALLHAFSTVPSIHDNGIVIGVFGYIQALKGARIIVELAKLLERLGRKDVRIVIVGELRDVDKPLPSVIKICGRYSPNELPRIIEKEGINIGFMSSIWPETFSYVTHELKALEMPIVCFDIGAPRDVVAQYDMGAVIPEMTAESAWRTIDILHQKIVGKINRTR